MSFFHGARTIERDSTLVPIRSAFGGVIFVVGTAPVGPFETVTQVFSLADGTTKFGANTTGYTIPRALEQIFAQKSAQGAMKVFVVNVLDRNSAIATTTVTAADVVFDGDVLRLPRILTSVTLTGDAGTPTYVEDTDYTLDATSGIVTRIDGGAISANAVVEATYTFSSGGNRTQVTEVDYTFPTSGVSVDVVDLDPFIISGTLTVTGDGATPSYTEDTDYSVDYTTGKITRIGTGAIAVGGTIEVTYQHLDPTTVQDTQLIGGTNVAGDRTGLELTKDLYNLFGVAPRIIIIPGYSSLENITSAMETAAEGTLGARAIVDAPIGTTVQTAITGRGPNGTINFFSSSRRLALAYPHVVWYDSAILANTLVPLSPFFAGIWANKVEERGIQWSPSNTEINNVLGLETQLQYQPGELTNEVIALNEVGITTVVSWFGSGFRLFGNRSAAWPTNTNLDNFLSVRFAQDIIEENIRNFAMSFVDRPITNQLIDSVLESIRAYLRSLVNEGVLVDFSIAYDPNDNPAEQIALGRLRFALSDAPPPPAEDIGFFTTLDVSLLDALNVGREPIGG